MRPHVDGLRERGITAVAIDLPKHGRTPVKAEKSVPVFAAALDGVHSPAAGGHSYGGRVASMLAANDPRVRALVLFSYPLHRPGHYEWEERSAHWPRISCPVLLLSGESDPFARIDLLRAAVKLLPEAELVTYARLGHGLLPVLDDALDRVASFLENARR
jgi:predicted alpha/beta-hydrolase family hydrolase